MTVSAAEYLKGNYNATQALGSKSISSDATLLIEGHESLSLLIKQFPWPILSSAGEIDVAGPLGMGMWEQQQLKTNRQGAMAMYETQKGNVARFMEEVFAGGGKFQAIAYEGMPDKFVRAYRMVDCFWIPEDPDRDWENRAQLTMISGTLFYNFFGDKIPGNVPVL